MGEILKFSSRGFVRNSKNQAIKVRKILCHAMFLVFDIDFIYRLLMELISGWEKKSFKISHQMPENLSRQHKTVKLIYWNALIELKQIVN